MSSLHDPFDLLQKGQKMDNVVPFLPQNKIDAMTNIALATPQLPAGKEPASWINWKFGGLAIAACLALFMAFLPATTPTFSEQPAVVAESLSVDFDEFSELAMLETWEKY